MSNERGFFYKQHGTFSYFCVYILSFYIINKCFSHNDSCITCLFMIKDQTNVNITSSDL